MSRQNTIGITHDMEHFVSVFLKYFVNPASSFKVRQISQSLILKSVFWDIFRDVKSCPKLWTINVVLKSYVFVFSLLKAFGFLLHFSGSIKSTESSINVSKKLLSFIKISLINFLLFINHYFSQSRSSFFAETLCKCFWRSFLDITQIIDIVVDLIEAVHE